MNDSSPARKSLVSTLPGLAIATIPLSLLLAFLILPLAAKSLLPLSSGTSSSWVTCLTYFQLTLLLGYLWAAWLGRQRTIFQVAATTGLSLVAVLTFHLPSAQSEGNSGQFSVIWQLIISTLPALVLLFSAGPILREWLRRFGLEVPYYVHVIALGASLAGFVLYPFLIETSLGLADQAFYAHGLLLIVAGLLAGAGYIVKGATTANEGPPPVSREASVTPALLLLWLALSAVGTVGVLGATYHYAAEIGSGPIAWVGPLGAYLFSFMVTFSGRWRRWMTLSTIVWVSISLTGYMVAKGYTNVTVNGSTALWLLSLSASTSFLVNALLENLRPQPHSDRFLRYFAAGGVLGGLATAIFIPVLLTQSVEAALAAAAVLTTALLWLTGRRDPATVLVLTVVLLVPVLGLGVQQMRSAAFGDSHLRQFRSAAGHLLVKTDARSVVLSHDTTTRASQLTADAAARRHPTLYHTEGSGVGRVIQTLQQQRSQMVVGVIGTGAGTLAAYARTPDAYDFWDVNPDLNRVAKENFTFVADSAGQITLGIRDGRGALAASKKDYDLIVVDALTSAGIPSHLLTSEALSVYLRRLAARDGILAVHVSSRYANLFPVIEATARTLGRASFSISTEILSSKPDRDWDATRTEYVIVCRPEQLLSVIKWFPLEEEPDRIHRTVTTVQSPLINRQLVWTDDRNATLDALELGRYLATP